MAYVLHFGYIKYFCENAKAAIRLFVVAESHSKATENWSKISLVNIAYS